MSEPREDIRQRAYLASRAFARRDELRTSWQEIWDYTAPDRYVRARYDSPTPTLEPRPYRQIYDSTAVDAIQELVDELLTGLIPHDEQWFQLGPGVAFQPGAKRDFYKSKLEVVARKAWLHINNSNVHGEAAQALVDYVTVGPMIMKTEPGDVPKTVRFRNYPVDTAAFEEGRDGRVAFTYIEIPMQAWDIMGRWKDKIDDPAMLSAMQKDPHQTHMLWSMSWPADRGTQFHYVLICRDKPDMILEEKMLDANPYQVPRFAKIPGNPFGRGLGTIAHADVLALNRMQELFLQGLSLEMLGQWSAVDDNVFDPYSYQPKPNQVVVVNSNDENNPSLRRLESPNDINIARIGINDKRADVRNMFRANRFGQHGLTPPTATEIIAREQVLLRAFGGALPTLINEWLIPMIQRTIHIVEPELKGLEIDRVVTDVVFTAPIPRAIRVQKAQSVLQFAQSMGVLGQLDPSALAIMNVPEIGREMAEQMGIQQRLLRNQADAEELVEQGMAGQQMMMQQAQAMKQQGEMLVQ